MLKVTQQSGGLSRLSLARKSLHSEKEQAELRGLPSGSSVKSLPGMQETQGTWVQSLGQDKPLEEEMATHSSIPAWKISWTEEPGGLQTMGPQSVRRN